MELRKRGHDIITAEQAGLLSAKDLEFVRYCNENSRILLTLNKKHFIKPANLATSRSIIIAIVVHPTNPRIITSLLLRFLASVHPIPIPSMIRIGRQDYHIITPDSDVYTGW
ncbi:MAG: DUF5615 family PIN-like protein [Candidatus Poribacteria bacterium]